jgi:hypothetical protein
MAMNRQELKLILEEGEGYRVEFKEKVSDVDREMVAFGQRIRRQNISWNQ